MTARSVASLLVLVFALSCGSNESFPVVQSADVTEEFTELNSLLHGLYRQTDFNGVVMIARDGKPLYTGLFGVEDASGQDTLTMSSMFRLASVSKAFTSAGILRLCAKGQLDLDAPVANYIACFPYPEVSARHLMNHNSGVPDLYMDVADENPDAFGSELSIAEVVQIVCDHPQDDAPAPLEEHRYNNTGYVMLAGLIEQISGMSFEDFMKQEIFDPMGMQETRVWNLLSKDKDFPNKVTGFGWSERRGRTEVLPGFIDGVAGDGAVFCSLNDFLIWNDFWNGNDLIPDSLLQEAFVNPVLASGEHTNYGFGWGLGPNGTMAHGGGWLMALTQIVRDPENGLLGVMLCNNGSAETDRIRAEMNNAVMKLLAEDAPN